MGALRDAFHGRLGGPLAELATLTGEWLGVEQADVVCEVRKGEGRIAVGGKLRAVTESRRGPDGTPTTLRDAFFSTVPGSPAWVAKGDELTVVDPRARDAVRVRGPERDPVRLPLRDVTGADQGALAPAARPSPLSWACWPRRRRGSA